MNGRGGFWRIMLVTTGTCLALAACGSGVWFHSYRQIPAAVWAKSDTLSFELPEVPDSGCYDFFVEMRTTAAFPYTGMKVAVLTGLENPLLSRRDTIDCPVLHLTGEPMGEGITLHHHEYPLFRLTLPAGARGTVRLYHIMRREDMPGIVEVGLKVLPPV